MAIVEAALQQVPSDALVQNPVWSNMANGDTGAQIEYVEHLDRCVQVHGTFGSDGTVIIQGSNNGTDWVTLTDPAGNDLSFTAAGMEQVVEAARYIRPVVTNGDETTSLTVNAIIRRWRY